MARNIVLLFDGTANKINSDRSNILRLYGALEKSDSQIVYYSPGVGTFGGENSLFYHWRRGYEVVGMATGWGLDHNVKAAYRFLVRDCEMGRREGPRDRLYIFGFSRGAYTARVLAGFLNAFGYIEPVNLNLLDAAYGAYKGIAERPDRSEDWAEMDLYRRVLRPALAPVALLGLFDTVASVVEVGRDGPRFRSHAATSHNPSVAAVRHAVALDERRGLYRPLLWPVGQRHYGHRFGRGPWQPQDVREMWFAGAHSDVGGGYPEDRSGLAKVALNWMINETAPSGLRYRERVVERLVQGQGNRGRAARYSPPDPMAPAQASLTPGWWPAEFLPQRLPADQRGSRPNLAGFYLPLFSRRQVPAGALVHASVAARQGNARLASPNLPPDARFEA